MSGAASKPIPSDSARAPIHHWVVEPPPPDVAQALSRLAATEDVRHIAVMPDVHLARGVCIGTVVGTGRRLFPEAVGGDIGCGVATVALDVDATRLADPAPAAAVLTGLARAVPRTRHASAHAALPDDLAARPLSAPRLTRARDRVGRLQFGTLGRGNHFLELQRDAAGALWITVHSGSRGIGNAIRDHHTDGAEQSRGLAFLDAESEAGAAYLSDMAWALDYAAASRRRMLDAASQVVSDVLGAALRRDTYVDCHHNTVYREDHGGGALWVHRKGAIAAGDGVLGLIPGSMGSATFHTAGRGHPDALASSSHGAGRVMSRTEARRRVTVRALHEQMTGVWFDHRRSRALCDEAPAVYRDIGAVMRAQSALTRILRAVTPVLSYK
jgi:tRNA-splicing ligase RtcB